MNVNAHSILDMFDENVATDARNLFLSPRNGQITHINETYEIVDPATSRLSAMKGVTKALAAFAWPHYDMAQITKNVEFLPVELRGEKAPRGVGQLDGVGMNSGQRRGTRVHNEVELIVHGHSESVTFQKHVFHPLSEATLSFILNPADRRASHMTRESAQFGLGFDNWMILGAEVPLFDEDACLASSMDIVLINNDGELCIVELKVGYAETFHSTCGLMKNAPGNAEISLSPLNQALMQVAFYGIMARRKYNVENVRMVVLNVNYNGTREFVVTPDFLENAALPMYIYVATCIHQERQQRKAIREQKKEERKQRRLQQGLSARQDRQTLAARFQQETAELNRMQHPRKQW